MEKHHQREYAVATMYTCGNIYDLIIKSAKFRQNKTPESTLRAARLDP